jgi:hypothetical protein
VSVACLSACDINVFSAGRFSLILHPALLMFSFAFFSLCKWAGGLVMNLVGSKCLPGACSADIGTTRPRHGDSKFEQTKAWNVRKGKTK